MSRLALRVVRSGWIPAVLAALFSAGLLRRYEVSAEEIRRYAIWLAWGVALPGTLLWRSLRGAPRSFVEDVAAGSALGFAIEIGVYVALRAMNAPHLIVWWPVPVVAAFAVASPLRKHWRSGGAAPAPPVWAWTMAALVALAIAWVSYNSFPWYPFGGPGVGYPYPDTTYHLALASEIKHHVPPTWPYVLGEPLRHHWFPHAEVASSSWATGIELRVILERLQIYPMLAIAIVVTASTAQRLARRWWPGPFAVIFVWFVSAFTPFHPFEALVFEDQRLLGGYQWQSPTHLVGAALFAPVALLVIDRFRKEPRAAGNWILITVLLLACVGSKSTILPLFLAGMLLAGLVHLIAHFRISVPALLGGAIGGGIFAFGTYVLYGGGAYGLGADPLSYFDRQPFVRQTLGYELRSGHFAPYRVILAVALLTTWMWLMRGAGAFGLLARRGRPRDPSAAFFLGMVAAGFVAFLLLGHPGLSQLYFVRSAFAFVGVLGAAGIAALIPPERKTFGVVGALTAAAAFGGWIAATVGARDFVDPAAILTTPRLQMLAEAMLKPMLVVTLLVVQAGIVLGIAARKVRWLRGMSAAMMLAAAAGTGLPATFSEFHRVGNMVVLSRLGPRTSLPDVGDPAKAARTIPVAGIEAARWLRDHSRPGDVIATNTHCRSGSGPNCDNRHFWVSAYAERRVLVEGWGYMASTIAFGRTEVCCMPFPYPDRLAENDLAFRRPFAQTLEPLKAKYGVRWLFVDERYDPPSPALATVATLVHRNGPFAVYELD